MNKSLLCLLASILFGIAAKSQAPQSLPFQGIARDVHGVPLPSQLIGVRLSIHDSIATGTIVYQERDTVTTSDLGLFTLNVGSGTVLSGTFSTINWANNSKYIQVEMDTSGGATYTNMGTSKMLSVPYAQYASTSGNPLTNSHVFVGNSSNMPADVAMTGDVSISNTGVTTVNTVNGGSTLAGWVLISTDTASNSASVDFTGLTSTYSSYAVVFSNVTPVSSIQSLNMIIGTGSGPTWQTGSVYTTAFYSFNEIGGAGDYYSNSASSFGLNTLNTGTGSNTWGTVYLNNPSSTAGYNGFTATCASYRPNSPNIIEGNLCFGCYNSITAITAVRFLMNSGNISAGTFKLYGIK